MSKIKGDFLGFTFDGIHSSDLGIFRTSDGNRYNENLLPGIQDKTIQIPGGDGFHYLGSSYTQKQFNISIAYDELTEEQLRNLKRVFSDKKIHGLIFDELPYKEYKVKITGNPSLKYVCFNRNKTNDYRATEVDTGIVSKSGLYGTSTPMTTDRIYKGEGQLNFISYTPFARSRYKFLDEYVFKNIPEWGSMNTPSAEDVYYNYFDWADSSNMIISTTKRKRNGVNYVIDKPQNGGCMYYNAGDVEVPFKLKIWFYNDFKGGAITCESTGEFIELGEIKKQTSPNTLVLDAGIQINSRLNLIEGIDEEGNSTGTIYNKYILNGDFFKLPTTSDLEWLNFTWAEPPYKTEIEYNYLYY